MVFASLTGVLSTFFAAVAAVAALAVIVQARFLHQEDVRGRDRERAEHREQFETEMQERQRASAAEQREKQLEQLGRVSDMVGLVRETARREADENGNLLGGGVKEMFYFNTRAQLELAVVVFSQLGGADLPACTDLAIGSTMNYLNAVIGAATSAFDELTRVAKELQRTPPN